MEQKEQKGGFVSMLLGTLGASSLREHTAWEGFIRAGYGSKRYSMKDFYSSCN